MEQYEYYLDVYKLGFQHSIIITSMFLMVAIYLAYTKKYFVAWVIHFVAINLLILNLFLQDLMWLSFVFLIENIIVTELYWKILAKFYCRKIKKQHIWEDFYSGEQLLYQKCTRCSLIRWNCIDFPKQCMLNQPKIHWQVCQCGKRQHPDVTD